MWNAPVEAEPRRDIRSLHSLEDTDSSKWLATGVAKNGPLLCTHPTFSVLLHTVTLASHKVGEALDGYVQR